MFWIYSFEKKLKNSRISQDGFFDGELLDGRRGLVPSNFIEKLVGADLIDFHHSVVMGIGWC